MHPISEGHDVRRPDVLDLQHGPLAGRVRLAQPLRHDPVETRSLELGQPAAREVGIVGRAGEVHGRRDSGEQVLELGAALREGRGLQVAIAAGEQVERDEEGGGPGGEGRHAGGGRVDALAQGLPVQSLRSRLADRDDDLAVDEAGLRQDAGERVHEFREVAGEGLGAAGTEFHALAVPRGEHPEPVPLRLEAEPLRIRDGRHRLGEHGRGDLVSHGLILPSGSLAGKDAHRPV